MISVYHKKTSIELGQRKIEVLDKYREIILRGRSDPVWFIETFLDVKLTDYQKWIIASAWTKQTVCLVCSRNTGKSFIAGVYIMARAILFPGSKIWLMSASSAQAQDTFTKMEDLAKHNITSVKNDRCIFANEVVKNNSNTDGFKHDKDKYQTVLWNGSVITTLVGKAESIVGKRSNLSIFDESCIIPDDFFARAEPFTTQSSDFVTGEGVDLEIFPNGLPNQNLYLSSAGDTSGHLWQVYKDCAKRMAQGFNDSFVADISCEIPLHPTIDGKPYPPLFDKARVDAMMRSNPYRALREYYNVFDQTGGTDMVISRDVILRNEQVYLPVFCNKNSSSIYGLFYDPSHQADNSFVLICEYFKDADIGWKMKIINGINLLYTLPNGDKKPMRSTEQLDWIRQLMIDYNGPYDEYTKIHLAIDPGSGGGGMIYSDFLIQEWQDKNGMWHHGVIDMDDEPSRLEASKFPRAIKDVLSLPSAIKYKNDQYAALSEMASNDLIIFPAPLPNNGQYEINNKKVILTSEEIRALLEIDLMKEEVLMMRKTKTEAGNIRYALQADKQRTAHDDRAYTLSMAAWYLQYLRRRDQYDIDTPKQSMKPLIDKIGKGGGAKNNNVFGSRNPFSRGSNPFKR